MPIQPKHPLGAAVSGAVELEAELKPCPFCGTSLVEAHSFARRSSKTFVHAPDVECPASSIRVTISDRDDTSSAWNRRADDGPSEREARAIMDEAAAIERAQSAEAERDTLLAQVGKMRNALEEISERHIPDQPAAYGGDELSWAQRQHGALRQIARAALTKEPS